MNNQFWDNLLFTASAIEKIAEADQETSGMLEAHLESIEVMYSRHFDPADEYAEYVAVTLCRAINKVLSRQ